MKSRKLFSHRSVFEGRSSGVDPIAINTMLHAGVPPFPLSPWLGVRCLPPELQFDGYDRPDLQGALRQAISAAGKSVTVSMSGGVDSSLIAALAKSEGLDVQAITIQFRDRDLDTENAVRIARALGIDLEIVRFDLDEALSLLPKLAHCELPISDSSALSTFILAVRAKGSVILDGVAADALYPSRRSLSRLLLIDAVPWPLRLPAAIPSRLNWRSETARKLKKLSRRTVAEMQLSGPYDGVFYKRPDMRFVSAWYEAARQQIGPGMALIAQAVAFSSMGRLAQKYTAVSTPVCFPFVEAADLTGQHLDAAEPKKVLKDMLCQYVPAELVYRRKYGFSMDQRALFSTQAFRDRLTLASHRLGIGEPLVAALNRNQLLPWYAYNLVWSVVSTDVWMERNGGPVVFATTAE